MKPPSDGNRTQRLKIRVPEGGSGLRIKSSGWGSRTLTMTSEEGGKTLQITAPREGKGLRFQISEEGAKIPKDTPLEEEDVPSRLVITWGLFYINVKNHFFNRVKGLVLKILKYFSDFVNSVIIL